MRNWLFVFRGHGLLIFTVGDRYGNDRSETSSEKFCEDSQGTGLKGLGVPLFILKSRPLKRSRGFDL